MHHNIFPSNHMKNNNCINNLSQGHRHSCPFCKCQSLDALDKISPKHYVDSSNKPIPNNPFLTNPTLSKKSSNHSQKTQNLQNVYYRPSDIKINQSISPNINKKIVIQYFSPATKYQYPQINTISTPFFQQKNSDLRNTKISPTKISPRTIYNNQSTPPKAKFLLKVDSKKKSLEKVKFQLPFQNHVPLQKQKIKEPNLQNKPQFFVPYEPFKFLSNEKMQKKVSIQTQKQYKYQPFKYDYLEGIFRTQTKNFIQQKPETPQSVGSPFNSLFDTTPQIIPYGSFSSTPIIPNDFSQKRQKQSSIKKIAEFDDQPSEIKLNKMNSQPVQIQKYQFTPKEIQIGQRQNNYNRRFEKTLGKNQNDQRFATQNELIYSQSDQKTIENLVGSQKNIFQSKSLRIDSNQTKSERNTRMISDKFEKKKNKFDLIELSDNFETPKSKYKAIREAKINESKNSIKFKVIGQNRKSKISGSSKQSMNQLVVEKSMKIDYQKNEESIDKMSIQLRESVDSKLLLKQQSLIKGKNQQKPQVRMQFSGFDRDEQKEMSIMSNQVRTIERDNSLTISNQYAGQLTEQLNLNYDYYFLKQNRKHSILLKDDNKDDNMTKVPDSSGNQQHPDSSASSHGPVNISF